MPGPIRGGNRCYIRQGLYNRLSDDAVVQYITPSEDHRAARSKYIRARFGSDPAMVLRQICRVIFAWKCSRVLPCWYDQMFPTMASLRLEKMPINNCRLNGLGGMKHGAVLKFHRYYALNTRIARTQKNRHSSFMLTLNNSLNGSRGTMINLSQVTTRPGNRRRQCGRLFELDRWEGVLSHRALEDLRHEPRAILRYLVFR